MALNGGWAKMPNAWVRSNGLKKFSDLGSTGKFSRAELNISISSLKTYLAICTRADFHSGIARTTYAELSQLTEQSRAVTSRSLALLEAHQLIACASPNPRAGTHISVSGWTTEVGFAKVPKGWLLEARERKEGAVQVRGRLLKLKAFRFDNRLSLTALKVYLVLLAYRDSGKGSGDGLAIISYSGIAKAACIGRHQVSEAVTKLLEMNLISFRSGSFRESEAMDFDRTNRYLIKGLNVRWKPLNEGEGKTLSKETKSKAQIEAANQFVKGPLGP